jgi:alanine dehydrogenase
MIVGVPKETKKDEYRVGIVPAGAHHLKLRGHTVLVQSGAGEGSGISDSEYRRAGARIVRGAEALYARSDMVMKVKEPQPPEVPLLRRGQIVFAYFHLASSRKLTNALLRTGIIAVAYETIRKPNGELPLLIPMSEVAGRMAVQEGAKYLERPMQGRGILLSGVPGVAPAEVIILGGGTVGANAARMAAGMGARVTVLDIDSSRLRYLEDVMPPNVRTLMSDAHNVRDCLEHADLVIGAVLVTGGKTPVLVKRSDLKRMKRRSVMVDVSIDQGGCFETSRPTTHSNPVYLVDGVLHYCVTNMPGAVGRTSTYALTNVTLPYAVRMADKGVLEAAREDAAIKEGVSMVEGKLTCRIVAKTFRMRCHEF